MITLFVNETLWLFWTSIGVTIVLAFMLFCFSSIAKKVPLNYILLFVFTFFNSYFMAGICTFADPKNVIIAAALTFTVFIAITSLSFFVRLIYKVILVYRLSLT